jgi:hypothetical protein
MGTISSKNTGKLYLFFYGYKYDDNSFPYLLIDDIIKYIVEFRILIEHCKWLEVKKYFWNRSGYLINNNRATLFDNTDVFYIRSFLAKTKYNPIWTIHVSGYFQIICVFGSNTKEVLDNIKNSKNTFDTYEILQITVDIPNKRFIIDNKIYEFQDQGIEELICIVVISKYQTPIDSFIKIMDFKYLY